MKRLFIHFLFFILFFGCERTENPSSTLPTTGTVSLSFNKQSTPAAVQMLVVTMTRSGFPTITERIDIANDTSSTVLINGLAAGLWTITIDAKNAETMIIYTGTSNVLIAENTVSHVNITLNSVSTGVGSVQINVLWGSAAAKFPKLFGGTSDDFAMSVAEAKDGGYLVGGIDRTVHSDGDAWVVKTDGNGTFSWSKGYGSAYEDRVNSIMPTTDGGFLLAGYINGGAGDAWLAKIDSLGTMLWQKNYGVPGDDSFLKVRPLSDGSVLVIGYTYLSDFSKGNFFDGRVVHLSPDGTLLWSTTVGDSGGDYTTNFIEIPGDGIYVSGFYGSNFSNNYDLWFMKLDLTGTILWTKTYGDGSEERTGGGMVTTSDGDFIFSGYRNAGYGQVGILTKVDKFGTLLWIKEYPSVAGNLLSLQRLPDNTIVAAGYSTQSGLGQQGVLMKVTESGALLWTKHFGGTGTEAIFELQITKDLKIITGGYSSTNSAGARDYWLMKLNFDGIMQ
jgi:hypothetical protein